MSYQLLFDGFEDYATYADLNTFGYATANSWGEQLTSILPTGGRRGGACARIVNGYSGGLKWSIPASSQVVLGLALRMNEQGEFNSPMGILLLGAGNVHAQLSLQEDAVMTLNAGGAQERCSWRTVGYLGGQKGLKRRFPGCAAPAVTRV